MAEHPNLAMFREIYATFKSGDMEGIAGLTRYFADELVWHAPGSNPLSGTHRGRQAVFESFAFEFELSHGTYDVAVREVLASDDIIVAFCRGTATRERKTLDEDYAIVWHVRNGKIDEAWEAWADQAAVDEFWS